MLELAVYRFNLYIAYAPPFSCHSSCALQEHAYYASFGYHVTNPFAVSSRSGSPEDLKSLIDAAHGMGIVVLLDVVHSHISSNADDGLAGTPGCAAGACSRCRCGCGSRFVSSLWGVRAQTAGRPSVWLVWPLSCDARLTHMHLAGHLYKLQPCAWLCCCRCRLCAGFDLGQSQDCSYFRGGEAGYHKQWDSRILNYGHWEVQRYLLSNLRYWLDEFQFDGFR